MVHWLGIGKMVLLSFSLLFLNACSCSMLRVGGSRMWEMHNCLKVLAYTFRIRTSKFKSDAELYISLTDWDVIKKQNIFKIQRGNEESKFYTVTENLICDTRVLVWCYLLVWMNYEFDWLIDSTCHSAVELKPPVAQHDSGAVSCVCISGLLICFSFHLLFNLSLQWYQPVLPLVHLHQYWLMAV